MTTVADGTTQERALTVSSLTVKLKSLIEGRFSRIYIEGEISGFRLYPSGHAYFTLKDEGAQMPAVMFKSSYDRCRAKPALKDGAKVMLYATASLYPQRGSCQLVVLAAKPTGEGDLMQKFLELKAKLADEGLFDTARKRLLPPLPRRIGLVTSTAGAVVHDMCRVMMRRCPNIEIRICPAVVQGVEAPRSVIAALGYFNAAPDGWRPDVVVVARGGGSMEDLFCFNDESLVRAVAASQAPVVSAVGHETDFTLCDFAADVRAGTPSIAAELVVPVLDDLRQKLDRANSSIASALRGKYQWFAQRIDGLGDRLVSSLRLALSSSESSLRELTAKLEMLSPYAVLDRGYSITVAGDGTVVKRTSDVKPGDMLTTRLADGTIVSEVK